MAIRWWQNVPPFLPEGLIHHRLGRTQLHSSGSQVLYIPGKHNILADQLSRPDQILLTEWSLLPCVFDRFCGVFGRSHLNLFATRASNKFPLYMSPVPDLLAWTQDTLHLPSDLLDAYAFPPFTQQNHSSSQECGSSLYRLMSGSIIEASRPSSFNLGFYPATRQKGWLFAEDCNRRGGSPSTVHCLPLLI